MSGTFAAVSPIDGSVYVERSYADRETIDATFARAGAAQKSWRTMPLEKRQAICSLALDCFVAKKDDIAMELCWQMGRPIRFAGGEVSGVEERGRAMIRLADQGLAPITLDAEPGYERWIQREPVGVVFVVAPWNYPYLTAVNTIFPAILAGNSVVLKPSTQTPLSAERFSDAFRAGGLPEGVFQYLHLTHGDTEMVIRGERIHYVAFTGSVPGGEMVERAAAGRFITTGLELGGKDPAYVREDADLARAVDTVMDGVVFNSGQSCCAIERVYVHEALYEDFVEQAAAWAGALNLGRPDEPQTTLGPMVRGEAADFVRQQVGEAIAQGAVPHIDSGKFVLDEPGSPYLAPQILTGVDHRMRIMTEETFGPVVGIQKVASDDEAIALMNDSDFGLSAAVFTKDVKKGIAIGRQVATGTFFLNRCDYLDPGLAWTGIKNSGRGCTLSVLGYASLTRPKSFHIRLP